MHEFLNFARVGGFYWPGTLLCRVPGDSILALRGIALIYQISKLYK